MWNRHGSWPAHILGNPHKNQAEDVVRAIEKGILPPFWIMEHDADKDTMAFLETRNIRVIRRWKGMALDIAKFSAPRKPPELELRFNDHKSLPDFRFLINGYLLSGVEMGDEAVKAVGSAENMSWIVAYLDNKPVSTGLLFIFEEVAGIYMIATATECRGRGYGSAITAALIESAFEKGLDKIILHATPLGEKVYSKLGFEAVSDMPILWKLGA